MTIFEFAERLLKGSGHAETLSDRPSQYLTPQQDSSLFPTPTSPDPDESQVVGCGGMVDAHSSESQGHYKAPSWAGIRPLSDIRELTEPSLADTIPRKLLSELLPRSKSRSDLSRRPSDASRPAPSIDYYRSEKKDHGRKASIENRVIECICQSRASRTPSPLHCADNDSVTSIYSILPANVPPRSSSRTHARSVSRTRQPLKKRPSQQLHMAASLRSIPPLSIPPPSDGRHTIPRRGQSQSPLRYVAARLDPVCHDTSRHIPSRTFIREPVSKELIEFPSHRHPRIELGLDLSAGVFVGGGSIEGTLQMKVDEVERIRHRRTMDIARISIDLLGIEEMSGNRRFVFLNLATELIDEDNPPPHNMVDTQEPISSNDYFWHLMPSLTNLAFNLSLPLNVGPPPFQSKHARIRYVLCASLLIRDHGKQYIVRTSEEVTVLSVYDPEKALMSLPSPLTAADEWIKARESTLEIIRVTAGLHRQVWVSGTCIYVDVHIANNSRRTIKKIELQLERDILFYKHAAASTMEKSAGQARIFDSNEKSILGKALVKPGSAGWHGVAAHQTHIRTCDLELPRGHATVRCGKYFEVRYFLNVVVGSAHTKLVTVQLPIVLIHMNSLDVVPNSVAQVAQAIEEKRSAHGTRSVSSPARLDRRPSQTLQGRAFAAPRMQSLDRMHARDQDLKDLGQVLDDSPRKAAPASTKRMDMNWVYHTPPSNRKARIVPEFEVADLQDRLRRVRSNESLGTKSLLHRGASLRSTRGTASALGFREAEVREDMELAGLGTTSSEVPFRERLEKSLERQLRSSKKRSVERWRDVANAGVEWLKGNGGKDEREREGWI